MSGNAMLFTRFITNYIYFNAAHAGSGMSCTGRTRGTSHQMSRLVKLPLVHITSVRFG